MMVCSGHAVVAPRIDERPAGAPQRPLDAALYEAEAIAVEQRLCRIEQVVVEQSSGAGPGASNVMGVPLRLPLLIASMR